MAERKARSEGDPRKNETRSKKLLKRKKKKTTWTIKSKKKTKWGGAKVKAKSYANQTRTRSKKTKGGLAQPERPSLTHSRGEGHGGGRSRKH